LASGAVVAAPTSNASFPDIQDHWARPFIEPLAEKDILAGYLDGTYRPNQQRVTKVYLLVSRLHR
jgi:hypothetical protein